MFFLIDFLVYFADTKFKTALFDFKLFHNIEILFYFLGSGIFVLLNHTTRTYIGNSIIFCFAFLCTLFLDEVEKERNRIFFLFQLNFLRKLLGLRINLHDAR